MAGSASRQIRVSNMRGGVSRDLSWGVVGGAAVGTGAEARLKPGMVRKVSGAWVLPPAIAHNDGSLK